jgi:hypothetical protein
MEKKAVAASLLLFVLLVAVAWLYLESLKPKIIAPPNANANNTSADDRGPGRTVGGNYCDRRCDDGYWCNPGVCGPPGAAGPGMPDCAEDECIKSCNLDFDCPSGLVCAGVPTFSGDVIMGCKNGCIEKKAAENYRNMC